MIIDIHTHTFPDKIAAPTLRHLSSKSHTVPFTDGTAAGLSRSMIRAGIDISVILPVATRPDQVRRINEAAAAQMHQQRVCAHGRQVLLPRLISFAAMHPDLPDWEAELDRIASGGFRGIKVHPVYQGVDLDDARFLRIFRRCGERGLAVLTHTGLDIGYPGVVHCSPLMAKHAIEEAGPFPFILGHMGGWREWEDATRLLAGCDVYLDTSFSTGELTPVPDDDYYKKTDLPMMEAGAFLDMVRAFGADRILFGTDSPWSDQAKALAWMRALPLPPDELDAILGGNAARLLNL